MRVVVDARTREHIDRHGGKVFVWSRAIGCCRGRTVILESATERPDRPFELVHASDGFQVFVPPGLVEPEELHFELSRRGALRAYWNGLGWVG